MNTKKIAEYLGLALVAVLVVSVGLGLLSGGRLGSTIGFQTSNGNQLTFNGFNSILQDLVAVRAPLASVVTSSVSLSIPAVTSSTPITTTTALTGISTGDLVIVSLSSSTPSSQAMNVTASGCATNLVCLHITNASGSTTSLTPGVVTFNLIGLPAASFVPPGALNTATSSSVN